MIAMQAVVAKAQSDESRDRLNPTHHQPDDIERGLVRVMKVLEHEHARGASAQLRDSAPATSWGRASLSTRIASSPPISAAGSSRGPSGRGVNSGSHVPHRTENRRGSEAR
jgi:hypothetical protein